MSIVLLILVAGGCVHQPHIVLTEQQANFVAKKVWQNEGKGLDKYLVHWNEGEDFASVGIGHFIWFSEGHTERFHEVFPDVVAFMESKNVGMPHWLNAETSLPWNTKEEFFQAKNSQSQKYKELFEFLKQTQGHQAEFLALRLQAALPKILSTLENSDQKKMIRDRFNYVLTNQDGSLDERGLYILLDYVNFKGEGTVVSERYNQLGWGLLQVLNNLDPNATNKYKAFADSAYAMLMRRINNSPPERGEIRWKEGWHIRLMTYWQ